MVDTMWIADKIIYRGEEDFVRAYRGSELVWSKTANKIYYTSTDGQVITTNLYPYTIISNIYSGNQGVITVDRTLTEIPGNAFSGESRLMQITIPESVTVIKSGAFYRCSSLTEITLPAEIEEIWWSAFWNCGLEVVECKAVIPPILGDGMDWETADVFSGCPLREIRVPAESVQAYQSSDWGRFYSSYIVPIQG